MSQKKKALSLNIKEHLQGGPVSIGAELLSDRFYKICRIGGVEMRFYKPGQDKVVKVGKTPCGQYKSII